MTLVPQHFTQNIVAGIDTKTSAFVLPPPKLLVAENVTYSNPGQVNLRNGFTSLSRNIIGGGGISAGQSVMTYNDELLMDNGTSLYSYDPTLAQWSLRGDLVSTSVSVDQVVRDTNQQTQADGVTDPNGGDLRVFAWLDSSASSGGVKYSVIDAATGQQLVTSRQLDPLGIKPRVLQYTNTHFLILWVRSSTDNMYGALVSKANPTATLTPVAVRLSDSSLIQLTSTHEAYDAIVSGAGGATAKLYIVYNDGLAGGANILYILGNTSTLTATTQDNTLPVMGFNPYPLTVFLDSNNSDGPVWIGANAGGANVYWRAYAPLLASSSHAGTFAAGANVRALAGYTPNGTAAGSWRILLSLTNTVAGGPDVFWTTNNSVELSAYIVTGTAAIERGLNLYSKPFKVDSVNWYAMYVQDSTGSGYQNQQPTYFLVKVGDTGGSGNVAGAPIAKMLYANAGAAPSLSNGGGMLAGVSDLGNAFQFMIPLLQADLLLTAQSGPGVDPVTTTTYAQTGVSAGMFDFFGNDQAWARAELGNNLHTSGGFVSMYDGNAPVEHGFHLFPENVQVATPTSTGTGIATATGGFGDYWYVATYEWTDAKGQIHRSAPSLPVMSTIDSIQIVLSSVIATNTITINDTVFTCTAGAPVADTDFQVGINDSATRQNLSTAIDVVLVSGLQTVQIVSSAGSTIVLKSVTDPPSFTYSSTGGHFTITSLSSVVVTIPMLRVTAKVNPRTPVNIAVYRTLANPAVGGLYFRTYLPTGTLSSNSNSPVKPLINVTTSDTITFTDIYTDAQIQGNQQLYTNGGVVENIEPGPVSGMALHRSRLWVVDSQQPNLLWYSKEIVPGAPVEFSDALQFNVDPRGGPITGIASLNDRLIVFKEAMIFYIAGQGPDATGAQSQFSDSIYITSDAGCTTSRSIVLSPVGLFFKSLKGYYLLGDGTGLSYVGADVQAYNSLALSSARLVATSNEIVFTVSDKMIVYNYYMKTWSTRPSLVGIDATIWQNIYAWIKDDGTVLKETPGIYTDDGAFVSMKIQTGWIKFSEDIAGFGRIWQMLLTGVPYSNHTLRVSFGFDFGTTNENIIDRVVTTSGSGPEQFIFIPSPFRRIENMIVTIQTVDPTPLSFGNGRGVSLVALTYQIGVEKKMVRLPPTSRSG